MDRRSCSITATDLECMLRDEATHPKALPLSLLKEITDGFSVKQEIGRGGFAVVYKGKLANRVVAVKRMSNTYMHEKEFQREVACLMMVKHENIVRFLGYCADTQGTMASHEGKFIMADVQQRLLCFEYLPNGSLDQYITDTSNRLNWRDRYHIIKGICWGLHYLHQENIVHLDLKPANILLGDNLVAKIADFGLSRCFAETQSRAITANIGGTFGYLAPEFCNGEITYKFDIYSLGVMITEILTGKKGYHAVHKQSINHLAYVMTQRLKILQPDNHVQVVESWSNMLESQSDVQLEQVRVCAEIGIECTNSNPAKRPDTQHIINRLGDTKTLEGYTETGGITAQRVEYAPNELNQGTPNASGEASSEENSSAVTVEGTNPDNGFWQNTSNLDMLNETMHRLDPDIRRCLEYCSIFPRGSMLRMGELVRLWVAQGFVKAVCATEDMDDVAERYIKELVSCSFMQPIETASGTRFRIHNVVHDLLDKVAKNCFRIENAPFKQKKFSLKKKVNMNARSRREEVWGGHIPRDVQHLFVQNYDGDLITEEILGLENLRTLIIYVVQEDSPVEEKIIDSICKRLLELRVLAVAFSREHDPIKQANKFPVPESISQLKHLSYLAFRTSSSWTVILPKTELNHIQVLDFGDGKIFEFTSAGLINLRHIFCSSIMKFPNIGRLTSLQTISKVCVRNERGCDVKQLRNLNKLRGSLEISGLENVKSKEEALQANLAIKERLTDLRLSWQDFRRRNSEVEAEVLEGMCPPVGLERLEIYFYRGSRYPDWMVGEQNGGPKDLQELKFRGCSQRGPAPKLVDAFPHLHVLHLVDCSWDALPCNMEHLSLLKKLCIWDCCNIRSLPTLPQSLEEFLLVGCNPKFTKSCETVRHENWKKIEHIPTKHFEADSDDYDEIESLDSNGIAPQEL